MKEEEGVKFMYIYVKLWTSGTQCRKPCLGCKKASTCDVVVNGIKCSLHAQRLCVCFFVVTYILSKSCLPFRTTFISNYRQKGKNMMSVAWYRHTPRSMPNTWPRPRNATISTLEMVDIHSCHKKYTQRIYVFIKI